MSENLGKIERIENEKLVELLGSIRQDSSEENMIAVLKEAAVAKFLVPVDGTEGNYSFHAVSLMVCKRPIPLTCNIYRHT